MRRRKHALVWLTLPLLFCCGAALADDPPSAVGRISYGDSPAPGAAICTGVLVAPDLVLTAAHCVRGAAGDPSSIRFDAGWVGGRSAGHGRGAEVILSTSSELAEDVALVVLSEPLPAELAEPIPLALPLPLTTVFALYAFRRDSPDYPSPLSGCHQLGVIHGLVGLDCPAVSGNSGTPLLQRHEAGWRVVAIMVAASSTGPVRSWAAFPPNWVLQRVPFQQD